MCSSSSFSFLQRMLNFLKLALTGLNYTQGLLMMKCVSMKLEFLLPYNGHYKTFQEM